MYINKIRISNFRRIETLELELNQHLNFIIGENDSGKTALIDALKLTLGTVSNDYLVISDEDFNNPKQPIKIEIFLSDFSEEQAVKFLDWGCLDEDGKFGVKIKLETERIGSKIYIKTKAGTVYDEDEGKALEPEVRALLNSVYLKPLRDAEKDLSAGKNSRLSQILLGHKYFINQEDDHELVEAFKELNDKIRLYFDSNHGANPDKINEIINSIFKEFMGDDYQQVLINAGLPSLKNILEKLSLEYLDNKNPGLGTSNLLFIAAELLLLNERKKDGVGITLIEELEAHIHPQKQLTLIDYLQNEAKEKDIQMFITSHSPNIASKVNLENVVICKSGNFYPLKTGKTLLTLDDYKFLQRFLDVTKSDLFFARGLIFVEGIAEALLIPVIAKAFDINLNQLGISVINLNGLSFERYLKVFIDNTPQNYLGIKISCITDRDGKKIKKEDVIAGTNENDGKKMTKEGFKNLVMVTGINLDDFKDLDFDYEGLNTIKFFHNKVKTLEFDLALGEFFNDLLNAREKVQGIQNKSGIESEVDNFKKAFMLYEKIENLKGDFAQELSFIWEGYLLDEAKKETFINNLKTDENMRYIIHALEHVSGEILIPR